MASAEAGHVCDQPAKVSVLDHFVHAVYLRVDPDSQKLEISNKKKTFIHKLYKFVR